MKPACWRLSKRARARASEMTWLAFVLLAMCGCASKLRPQAVPTPPKPPEDPWSWMPEDAAFTGRADVDALRKTALWPLWKEVAPAQQPGSWVDLAKVARVTFAGRGEALLARKPSDAQPPAEASYVLALEGAFGERELAELALRDQVAPEPRGLLTVYRRPEGGWAQITRGLIVMSSPDRLDQLVARASAGPGAAIKQKPLYLSLASKVEFERAHLVLLAEDPGGEGREVLARRANRYGLGELTREAVRLGLGLELGAEYRLVAVAEAADAARAQALGTSVREALGALADNFLVRMLGFSGLLSQLRVADDGSYVVVRGNFSEVALSEALQRVQGAFSFAGGGAQTP